MTTVSCPTCKRPVEWCAASRWRPFCSERCKLIDLGAWASERNVIAGEPIPEGAGSDPEATSPRSHGHGRRESRE